MLNFWTNEVRRIIKEGKIFNSSKWENVPKKVKKAAIAQKCENIFVSNDKRWGWCIINEDKTELLILGNIQEQL